MGHFSVSCAISGLNIREGDEIGFMPIIESGRHPRDGRPVSGHKYHVYSTDEFIPYLPPVYGRYDGYGGIEGLQESLTTKVIEKLFDRPAERVLNALGADRDAYSTANDISTLYMDKKLHKMLETFRIPDSELLTHLGFKSLDYPGFEEVYSLGDWILAKHPLESPEFPSDLKLYRWTMMSQDAVVQFADMPAYNGLGDILSAFAHYSGEYPGFPKEDSQRMTLLSSLSGTYFLKEAYEGMRETAMKQLWKPNSLEEVEKKLLEAFAFAKLTTKSEEEFQADIVRSLGGYGKPMQTWDELKYLLLYVDGSEYREMDVFTLVLSAANRMLHPTYTGWQDGNDPEMRTLLEVSMDILKRRAREYEEDE